MASSTIRRWVALTLKLAVSAALLALALSEADGVGHPAVVSGLSPTTIVSVIAIVVLQMAVISAWRLKLVMQLLGCRVSAVDAARITWFGFFIEQVGAVFVAGDVARIWLLRQANVALRTATEGPLLDRAVGLVAIVAMASLGMPQLWWSLSPGQQQIVLLAAGLAAGVLTTLAALATLLFNLGSRAARWVESLRALGTSTVWTLAQSSRPRIATVVLLAFATHSLNVVAIYLLLTAVGVKLGLATCFVFTPTVLLVSMLPASVSGWGVREGAFVLALKSFGVPSAHVLLASVLFGTCVLIASLPGAVIWLCVSRRSNSSSRNPFQGPAPVSRPIKLPW